MFYCLDRFIEQCGLTGPFLDIGCGIGDISAYVGTKGWQGKAIDMSDIAIARTTQNLKNYPQIQVEKKLLVDETGSFKTIFLWDVIEHIKEDQLALQKIYTLLAPGGYLLIAVPSNPREWRWDDDFYGHYRRYTEEDMGQKLVRAGLTPVVFWDFTYPVFWILRRMYTIIKKAPPANVGMTDGEKDEKTGVSATVNAWDIPIIGRIVSSGQFIWRGIYWLQFSFFKNKVEKGHEMFILARRPL